MAEVDGYQAVYNTNEHAICVIASYSAAEVSSTFQWYKDGVKINGATSAEYRVKEVSDNGSYTHTVTAVASGYSSTITSAGTPLQLHA